MTPFGMNRCLALCLSLLLACCSGCSTHPRSTDADSALQIDVVRITPSRSTFNVSGSNVSVGRRELPTISAIQDASKAYSHCVLHIAIKNTTESDFLLCSWDLRNMFVAQTAIHDTDRTLWSFQNTYRHISRESVEYDVLCPKNSTTKLSIRLGMTVFSKSQTELLPSSFPVSVEYEVAAGTLLSGRPVANGRLAAPTTISVTGAGTAVVSDDEF